MKAESLRITRKIKIGKAWVFAAVPFGRGGRPEAGHVLYKGERVAVDGGTFYLDHGHGTSRKHVACGTDPDSVVRAMKTQSYVLELRRRGMEVADAPEIVDQRRKGEMTLRAMRLEFMASPPAGFTVKSRMKYRNAFTTFETWGAERGVTFVADVTAKIVVRWIAHLQQVEGLDASTIVPKVRIVLAELKRYGVEIKLEDRDLPTIVQRERSIYTTDELEALFAACSLPEFELMQTFLLTGMRYREVAFLAWADIDPERATIRVTAKRELGFVPKAYHERTIPIPRSLVELLQARGVREGSDGAGLIFPTSRAWAKRGSKGGKADGKMLDKLKQMARRSGLNCGHCIGSYKGEPVTCETHAVCKRWGLHKFRHTYATSMLRDRNDIRTVKDWMGHKDLETTMIYLRALEAEEAQPQVERSMLAQRFGLKVPPAAESKETGPRASRPRG